MILPGMDNLAPVPFSISLPLSYNTQNHRFGQVLSFLQSFQSRREQLPAFPFHKSFPALPDKSVLHPFAFPCTKLNAHNYKNHEAKSYWTLMDSTSVSILQSLPALLADSRAHLQKVECVGKGWFIAATSLQTGFVLPVVS